jgi:hypothetical protein
LRDKAEELRTNADNIRVEECRRILLELADTASVWPLDHLIVIAALTAVLSLLDDLKEMIGNHYRMQLFEEARKQYAPATTDQSHNPPDDPDDPFV